MAVTLEQQVIQKKLRPGMDFPARVMFTSHVSGLWHLFGGGGRRGEKGEGGVVWDCVGLKKKKLNPVIAKVSHFGLLDGKSKCEEYNCLEFHIRDFQDAWKRAK